MRDLRRVALRELPLRMLVPNERYGPHRLGKCTQNPLILKKLFIVKSIKPLLIDKINYMRAVSAERSSSDVSKLKY